MRQPLLRALKTDIVSHSFVQQVFSEHLLCTQHCACARHWAGYIMMDDALPLNKEMATHSSILAWRILWTEEPGGLLSMGLHRVGHDRSDLEAALSMPS